MELKLFNTVVVASLHVAGDKNIITFFCNGLFKGHERGKFLLAFLILTFVALFFLRFLIEVFYAIHARFWLKNINPDGYRKFQGYEAGRIYKRWLKGEHNPEDIYCKFYQKYEKAGNICLIVWLGFVVCVVIGVLITL